MKNIPLRHEERKMSMHQLKSQIKSIKPVLVDTYINWSIPANPSMKEVLTLNDKNESDIKLDFDSQERLLQFLMRVI